MVNAKKRDILERYRHFLENNLILTEEFLRWFEEKKIFPTFVFEDIRVCHLVFLEEEQTPIFHSIRHCPFH